MPSTILIVSMANLKQRTWPNKPIFVYRSNVSDSSVLEVLHWYTSVNAALLDHLTNQIKETDNSGVWRYDAFWYIVEEYIDRDATYDIGVVQ